MKAFLSGLLSSDKIIDAGIAGADKLIFTSEEKADVQAAADALRLKFVEASLPMEVSRRFISVVVTVLWAINGAMVMALSGLVLGVDVYCQSTDMAAGICSAEIKINDLVEFGLWYVMPPFTTITGFYFWKKVEEAKRDKKK
jgi:hypothetical protein